MRRTASLLALCAREKRATAALLPLVLFILILVGGSFYVYGGHQHAFLNVNSLCVDELRTPLRLRSGWGSLHGDPLVVLQVSDLHVNDIDGGKAKLHFQGFTTRVLPRFAPHVDAVIVTGDLVSSKRHSSFMPSIVGHHSVQIESEWQWYNGTASAAISALKIPFWITVPGNHDVFGSSSRDLYLKYGVFDPFNRSGRSRVHDTRIRGHHLIAMDASLLPSPHRPMNFFGMVTQDIANLLDKTLRRIRKQGHGGANVVFGHYPSAVMAHGRRIGRVFADIDAEFPHLPSTNLYLSGHLHDLKGHAPRGLQASAGSGHLELQLPDMFTTRTFRILTVDHGLPSWMDLRLDEISRAPVVIVTNPPRAGVSAPGACFAARKSTHVRILVFPPWNVTTIFLELKIDGVLVGSATRAASDERTAKQMYTVPWNPDDYTSAEDSFHTLEVIDGTSRQTLTGLTFNLHGQAPRNLSSRWNAFVGAFFSLAYFDTIAYITVLCGLICALLCGICAHIIARQVCYALLSLNVCILLLLCGPLLIAQNLTELGGWGWISLRMLHVREGELRGGVDPFFSMFTIVFTSVLPSAFIRVADVCEPKLSRSILFKVVQFLASVRCAQWTLTIAGAHGVVSCLLSPSCVPLLVALVACSCKSSMPLKPKLT